MVVTNIAPYFALIVVFFLTALFIVKRIGFFQQAVQRSAQTQYPTLDGLRGFLALSVFLHHAVVSYYFFQTGKWESPPSNFYTFIGESAVSFFFMITGFLFWLKAIYGDSFQIKKFYVSRILRIYPVYLFSFSLVLITVLFISKFSLLISWLDLLHQIQLWIVCGIFSFPFLREINDFSVIFPRINQFDASMIIAGVNWTLVYELQFYLILPLLVIFAKPWRFFGLFAMMLLLYELYPSRHLALIVNFLFGMTCAHLTSLFQLSKLFSRWQFSIFAILLLAAIPIIFDSYITNINVFALIFILFVIIVYNNNLFGLLTASPSRYLGIVSYDIYLLHGIVLFIVFRFVNHFYPIKGMPALIFWFITGLCGVIIIGLSGLVHRFIEYPCMRFKPFSGSSAKN